MDAPATGAANPFVGATYASALRELVRRHGANEALVFGERRWTFTGDNWFWARPLVANGTAYIPYAGASFTINGQPIEARYVIDGMNVQVYPHSYNQNGSYYNNQNGFYNQNQYYNNGYNYNMNRRFRR